MTVLFIVHGLKKLVLPSRTFRHRTGKNILKGDTETYSFDFLTWQYGLAFQYMFTIGIPFSKRASLLAGSVMTRVQLPVVRRLESVDPALIPTTSQLLASITHNTYPSTRTLAM